MVAIFRWPHGNVYPQIWVTLLLLLLLWLASLTCVNYVFFSYFLHLLLFSDVTLVYKGRVCLNVHVQRHCCSDFCDAGLHAVAHVNLTWPELTHNHKLDAPPHSMHSLQYGICCSFDTLLKSEHDCKLKWTSYGSASHDSGNTVEIKNVIFIKIHKELLLFNAICTD